MGVIGERLLGLRRDADLTQDDLAAILHINKHSISSYERNRSEPPDAVKVEIARYFNVSVDYLLGLTDVPAPIDTRAQCVRLPAAFPRKLLPELDSYIEYLMYREKARGNSKLRSRLALFACTGGVRNRRMAALFEAAAGAVRLRGRCAENGSWEQKRSPGKRSLAGAPLLRAQPMMKGLSSSIRSSQWSE